MFFDNVEVPVTNLVGEENKGWDYGKFLLGNERTGIARIGASKERLRRIRQLASKVESGGKPIIEDPRFLEKLTAVEIELKALEMNQMRVVAGEKHREKGKPDPASSILKIKGSELQQATTELMMDVIGPFAAPAETGDHDGANEPDDWTTMIAPELLQLPQGVDLRRLERDPEEHHRQGGAGALRREASRSDSPSCPALCRASTPFATARRKTWMAGTSPAMTNKRK